MRVTILLVALSLLSGCVDASLKRERGATVNGYTTYTTTLHVEMIDEPVCAGSCQP
jgi:hypothetical protein